MIAVVPDDFEGDLMFLFLGFGGIVSGGESESNVLKNGTRSTSPCMPTKLLLPSLLGSTYMGRINIFEYNQSMKKGV